MTIYHSHWTVCIGQSLGMLETHLIFRKMSLNVLIYLSFQILSWGVYPSSPRKNDTFFQEQTLLLSSDNPSFNEVGVGAPHPLVTYSMIIIFASPPPRHTSEKWRNRIKIYLQTFEMILLHRLEPFGQHWLADKVELGANRAKLRNFIIGEILENILQNQVRKCVQRHFIFHL